MAGVPIKDKDRPRGALSSLEGMTIRTMGQALEAYTPNRGIRAYLETKSRSTKYVVESTPSGNALVKSGQVERINLESRLGN